MKPIVGVWLTLVWLRWWIAISSTSVIHPDEHFQNSEIAAGIVFDYDTQSSGQLLRTWEWQAALPVRSVVPVSSSIGLAFILLKAIVGKAPSGYQLFVAQRTFMWLASLIVDYTIFNVATHKRLSLILISTSPVMLTFMLRPFSNSIETILLSTCVVCYHKWSQTRSQLLLVLMSAIGSLAVFTRITFVAFAAPVATLVVSYIVRHAIETRSPRHLLPLLIMMSTFTMTSIVLATIDTITMTDSTFLNVLKNSSRLVWTPINLLFYNSSIDNLSKHGLHPRYLHFIVNWPMLFGIGLWPVCMIMSSRFTKPKSVKSKSSNLSTNLLIAMLIVPTCVLSIQPHQEARFLVPLILPLTLLIPQATLFQQRQRAKRKIIIFWSLWLIHSVLFVTLFGYLHQGGLIPTLFKLNERLKLDKQALNDVNPIQHRTTTTRIIFWQTFMPPRHLLLPLFDPSVHYKITDSNIEIIDLAGSNVGIVQQTFDQIETYSTSNSKSTTIEESSKMNQTWLVAPTFTVRKLEQQQSFKNLKRLKPLLKEESIGWHVDMDRLDQFFKSQFNEKGLGVWYIDHS
ncbi:alpha 1,2 mannosyltransferase [Microbotryomycetes sp. JL221]|nr:alpha 1,2 mannosyltransferase [Microbotryomycetes sp. JL221]